MDPRTAARTLRLIAAHLELRGESSFRVRAYEQAARALVALDTDDLGALDAAGELAPVHGIGPATLAIVRDLVATGESRFLEQLRGETPDGLLELLRVPGLTAPRIAALHDTLGIDSLDALERAARDGSLARVRGFGPRTIERLLAGITMVRTSGARQLRHHALASAAPLLAAVRAHPDVLRAEVAGSLRRHGETAGDVDVVAAVRGDPRAAARSFSRAPGVSEVRGGDTASPSLTFVDGARLDLFCVPASDFAVALWRATGSPAHVQLVIERLGRRGVALRGDAVIDAGGEPVPVPDESALYALAGLAYVEPERREGLDELLAAERGEREALLEPDEIRGTLHCHSTHSDGTATIAEMAEAARARGWAYIGITDHSQAAFYAGGLSAEAVRAQHEEIDRLNAGFTDFRILKGIECDILADGTLDYDDATLALFEYVVGSVHSRFRMDGATMTARILRALDDPRLTILAHPTGRLLLNRAPYALDVEVVLQKAAEGGAAVELNADPHRLDLDWRYLPRARALGVTIEIGPDAHSTAGLDNIAVGVGIARKGGLRAEHVLNTRSADEVLAFARARRR